MGVRASNNTKDHLRKMGEATLLENASDSNVTHPNEDSLRFDTMHSTKPCYVDLTIFRDGCSRSVKKVLANKVKWTVPFNGRPELIEELAPAIRDQLMPLAEKSVAQYFYALRAWWRLFDEIEAAAPTQTILTSTIQLGDLHRQCALDSGMDALPFGNFLRLANLTRTALGLRPLYWQPPDRPTVVRHLPPTWQTDLVRRALKRCWFNVLDRWNTADNLRASEVLLPQQVDCSAAYAEQCRLQLNYKRLDAIVRATGHPRPLREALMADKSSGWFYVTGYSYGDMLRGSYPDGNDVRAAFHLCLDKTGWNPCVLLSLDVNKSFIEPHPKDPGRYVLRGAKDRAGGVEQIAEGMFKTQGSAGVILQTLILRTAPLRAQLRQDLQRTREHLEEKTSRKMTSVGEINAMRRRVTSIEQSLRSPWLYASKTGTGIHRLSDFNFHSCLDRKHMSWLGHFISQLNCHRPADSQLAPITASDLRDVYATHEYHASGGSILWVKRALGHRKISSTQRYVDNKLLREEHVKLFAIFSEALWSEVVANGRVDPTLLAHLSRSGPASREQRDRLLNYRTLLSSRIGVGCKDPMHPPRHIAPDFLPDGKAMCHVQRCTLCFENAVIFPESLPGLCKRMAELRHLRSHMGVGPFYASTFEDELTNTEGALLAFDVKDVNTQTKHWEDQIRNRQHRVVEFDGELPSGD